MRSLRESLLTSPDCAQWNDKMDIEVRVEAWPLAQAFRITGRTYTQIEVVVAIFREGPYEGRGEVTGVDYLGETPDAMVAAIEAIRPRFRDGIDRAALQGLLPPGGARNALDCALWDLEATIRTPGLAGGGRKPPRSAPDDSDNRSGRAGCRRRASIRILGGPSNKAQTFRRRR